MLNRKEYYKIKRNLQFAASLPGESILSSIVKSLEIAYNYKGKQHIYMSTIKSTTKKC